MTNNIFIAHVRSMILNVLFNIILLLYTYLLYSTAASGVKANLRKSRDVVTRDGIKHGV